VDQSQLQPLADHLLTGYLDIANYATSFTEDHTFPPTRVNKLHHMLSVMQARIMCDADNYELGSDYAEFGRCEILDRKTERTYLLRSEVRIGIERAQAPSLFPTPEYIESPVVLLAYRFRETGLDLSVAGSRHRVGKFKLVPTGPPTFIATYPYPTETSPDDASFDQGAVDRFKEIGEIDDLEAGSE
jgi:hypothetical protein